MNWLSTIALLLVAYLAVFFESYSRAFRNLFGAQIDLLPVLMVYAGLSTNIATVALVASAGGFWFDSLSANPLGITVLPLFVVGLAIHYWRDLILREELYAQVVLGLGACALVPVLTLLSLLGTGAEPLLDWWSLWRWMVMAVGGGALTPVIFYLFDRLNRAFNYRPLPETSFRPDREIKRGRVPHVDY
jgi:hypothetical protein